MRQAILQRIKRGIEMPLVKVIRHGQITLPADFREELDIKEGDYLEAEMDNKTIVLRPKVFMDRADAVKALHKMMAEVHERTKDLDPKEIDEVIEQAIAEVRQAKSKKLEAVTKSKVK